MDATTTLELIGLTQIAFVLCEWGYIVLWTRRQGRAIVAGVTGALNNLRPGRGTGKTATERMAEAAAPPEVPPGAAGEAPDAPAPLTLPGIPQIAGIDPRALMEGKPILDKFMSGKKLTPEETTKGMQLLTYFGAKAKEWQGAPANGGGGGPSSGSPAGSGWE